MPAVFCTSKNAGPDYSSAGRVTMLYLGTSEQDAIKAVGDFAKYERFPDSSYWPKEFISSYSAIPADMDRELVRFYGADGWWFSIVMFYL